MSLINDALKRAKAVQAQTPPPPPDHLPLRPADPQVAVMRGVGLALPVGLTVVALLILFFAWRYYQDKAPAGQPEIVVAANSAPAPALGAESTVPASSAAAAITTPSPQATNVPVPAASTASVPVVTNEPPKPAIEPATSTNAVTTAEAAAAMLPPLKLQGVVYSRTRPSAVISGKTVFVGDRIREYQVVGIKANAAILTSGAQTNVLTLSD